jgi:hypothetical protein
LNLFVVHAAPLHDIEVNPRSRVLMPRTLQVVYSHDDYCLFAVFPTGVVLSVADGFWFCLLFE